MRYANRNVGCATPLPDAVSRGMTYYPEQARLL